MPELIPLERLQPSLLDRLLDDAPHERRDAPDRRYQSTRQLREGVLRDLGWLLNTTAPTGDVHPAVRSSTLGYGIPDLAGITASSLDAEALAHEVRDAVLRFEPRIVPGSLDVRVTADANAMGSHTLAMRIEGELWAVPTPQRIVVNSAIDLESGRVVVADGQAAR